MQGVNKEEYQKNLLLEYLSKYLEEDEIEKFQEKDLFGTEGLRKELAELDIEYFGLAYFPEYIKPPIPDFHKEIYNDLQDIANGKGGYREVIAAPRGHAKTTLFDFLFPLWCILYGKKNFILIVSDSYNQAKEFLANIKNELEDNQGIKDDFNDMVGSVWAADEIITTTGVKVQALGAKMKIRGRRHGPWRPDLIILDDIENDENVNTPEQRQKLFNWFTKAVSKAGDEYTDIVMIGTILHYDSLLSRLLRNPGYQTRKYKAVINWAKNQKLWQQWEEIYNDIQNENRAIDAWNFFKENEQAMLEGTEVLWSEKKNYYKLMEDRLVEGPASFDSEYQNEPINPEDCLFNEEWFEYFNLNEVDISQLDIYGAVDPSMGKSSKSDYSAIITLGRHPENGMLYVLDADIDRRTPDRIIDDIFSKVEWLNTYGKEYTGFAVETVQFQEFFNDELSKRSAIKGYYLPLTPIKPNKDKHLRIQSLQPYVKNKYLRFRKNQSTLLEQLKYYPLADHDDGPDALEMAIGQTKQQIFVGTI